MDKHRDFFSKNPRMRMLISKLDKMSDSKRENHLLKLKNFLKNYKI